MVAQTKTDQFLYNPRKVTCFSDIKTFKVWIKELHRDTDQRYGLALYEIKCLDRQFRVRSLTEYEKDGDVLKSGIFDDAAWEDPIPSTAAEAVLNKICRLSD